MSDLILEIFRAAIVCVIFVYLWLISKKEDIRWQNGWLYILAGFGLILFGMFIDITDNFPDLNKYVIIGDTQFQAFLEKVIGYLMGFSFLAIGFLKWMPTVILRQEVERKLKESHDILDLKISERTIELETVNNELQREIDEHHQTERKLRRSHQEWEDIFQAIGQPAAVLSPQHEIITANNATVSATGRSIDELIGKKCYEVFHGTDCPPYDCPFEKMLKSGQFETSELETLDGLYLVSCSPVFDDTGELVRVIQIAIDITKRIQAEIALRENERKYRELVQNANSIILRLDTKGNITFFNEFAQNYFGYSEEEILGKNMVGTIVPNMNSSVNKSAVIIEDIVRHPERYVSNENENMCKNGERVWVSWTNKAITNEEGIVTEILCIGSDISERKRSEGEKEKLQAKLQQAQKMEAIGTLAGGIAHDFNNILSSIYGYSELASLNIPEKAKENLYLAEVLTAARRAKGLVRQILAFSRQSEAKKIPVQIDLIVKEVLQLLRATLPTTIEIRQNIKISPGLDTVLADPTQIHQILMNLSTNAYHAMRERGGILEVSLTNISLDSNFTAQYPDLEPGNYLRLTVSDTGCGMLPAVMEKIFDPYFTTKEKDQGTGLGLAVVHGIVTSLDGVITVYSEPRNGTTFHVYLPVSKKMATVENSIKKSIPGGHERILFVDDEPALVDLGKQLLERLGYRVTTRTSSIEAFELFKARPDKFDLLLTDMTMPHMTGEKLAQEFMKIRPNIPVILCTGYSEWITEEKAKKVGIRLFAMKPLVMRELADAIRKVLDQEKEN